MDAASAKTSSAMDAASATISSAVNTGHNLQPRNGTTGKDAQSEKEKWHGTHLVMRAKQRSQGLLILAMSPGGYVFCDPVGVKLSIVHDVVSYNTSL